MNTILPFANPQSPHDDSGTASPIGATNNNHVITNPQQHWIHLPPVSGMHQAPNYARMKRHGSPVENNPAGLSGEISINTDESRRNDLLNGSLDAIKYAKSSYEKYRSGKLLEAAVDSFKGASSTLQAGRGGFYFLAKNYASKGDKESAERMYEFSGYCETLRRSIDGVVIPLKSAYDIKSVLNDPKMSEVNKSEAIFSSLNDMLSSLGYATFELNQQVDGPKFINLMAKAFSTLGDANTFGKGLVDEFFNLWDSVRNYKVDEAIKSFVAIQKNAIGYDQLLVEYMADITHDVGLIDVSSKLYSLSSSLLEYKNIVDSTSAIIPDGKLVPVEKFSRKKIYTNGERIEYDGSILEYHDGKWEMVIGRIAPQGPHQ